MSDSDGGRIVSTGRVRELDIFKHFTSIQSRPLRYDPPFSRITQWTNLDHSVTDFVTTPPLIDATQ
ncbi:hypothetical protein ABHV44_11045 [Flavobacteriales bacterium DA487]